MRLFMKKILFMIFVSLIFSFVSVSAEEQSLVSSIDKIVTQEHFLTKKEIKSYIDEKSVFYHQEAEKMIIKSLDEVKLIISDQTNMVLLKFGLMIFGIIFFASAFWYFIRLKLDEKKMKITDLKQQPYQKDKGTPQPESPLKQAIMKPEIEEKPVKKTFKEMRADIKAKKQLKKEAKKLLKEEKKANKGKDMGFTEKKGIHISELESINNAEEFELWKEWKKLKK